ncbi:MULTISPECIES: HAMP domain-containing sensor histidine kinase [unclassified Pseudoalteromonas]|uniref:sensor histidine kinase n=1 Tax=unclassified Pseudoalteromonas TaxID=194690 RepID=UPI0005A7A8F6|nr:MULTISPECIES: HAMP domain-containing sensor histidine kinase [unclassified Pseudoalteromonas]
MVNMSRVSLFTRLYISIAMAVVISATVTFIVIDDYFIQSDIEEFVKHTDSVYQDLLSAFEAAPNKENQSLSNYQYNSQEIEVHWLPLSEDFACTTCEYLGSVDSVLIYTSDMYEFIAVYTLEEYKLIIKFIDNENDADHQPKIIANYDLDDLAPFILLFTVLTSIGFTIYWPVRSMQKQINQLIQTQKDFGDGNMKVRSNHKLTKPLNKLADSFNTMADSITDTVNENQIFAQAVPHEVRTPLSRIQLATGLLRQNSANYFQHDLLHNIDTYIDDIDELISQMVEFSKLNNVTRDEDYDYYQTINFVAFIHSRVKVLKPNKKLDFSLNVDDNLEITTNPVYLRLLIDNLVKNAMAYAKYEIIISLKLNNNGSTIFSVEDDGPGIPNQDYKTIFIPFSRLDKSRSRKTGGLGLGLAISKAACKKMNGDISVINNHIGGAKFTCILTKKVT